MEETPPFQNCPEISVVVPVFKNEDTLHELQDQLKDVLEAIVSSYEIIYINDHCPNNSLKILYEIAGLHSNIVVVDLPKNIGQQRAVLKGLTRARGQWMVIIDADLQDTPEAIPGLFHKIKEGYGAVYVGRRGEYQSRTRLWTSRLFRKTMHMLCGMPLDAGIFMIMSEQMRDRVLCFRGHPFIVGMTACAKLPLYSIPGERSKRPTGISSYSMLGRLKVGFRAVFWTCFWKGYVFEEQDAPPAGRQAPRL